MQGKLEVLIAGAGVASLECAFALHALAAEKVNVTVLSPESEFMLRPVLLREPFVWAPARRYPLLDLVAEAGAELVSDRFRWLDAGGRVVHARSGREFTYDALVLALGARRRPMFRHAVTLDDRVLPDQVQGTLADIENGSVRRVALLVGSTAGWPLPLYELAVLLARRARALGIELEVTLATPEVAPEAVFGERVSQTVGELLEAEGVQVITAVRCEVPAPGVVSVRPGMTELEVDRVFALPQLSGPSTPGMPKRARGGFLSIDPLCRVRDVDSVYAVGDACDFPVRFVAVAAQEADTAAASIAAEAGAGPEPRPLEPRIHGMLDGPGGPVYLHAYLVGGHAHSATVSSTPTWHPAGPIDAPYLAPYLEAPNHAHTAGPP